MKILIVGCGAVGQVLGHFLDQAGVELCFYARAGSVEKLRQSQENGGISIYQVSHFHRQNPIHHLIKDYRIVSDTAGSQAFGPDQIWFTTPSTVLHTSWFLDFIREVPSKRVVCFPPEGERPEFYPDDAKEHMVFGGITFMAWQGDLDGGGGLPEAVNFWLPPLVQIPLIGDKTACTEVSVLLQKGGLRASVQKADFGKAQSSTSGLMSCFMAGLELSSWSLKKYRGSPWIKTAAASAKEATAGQLPGKPTVTRILFELVSSPAGFTLASLLMPLLFPFDIEKYIRFHYTKTHQQTLSLLELYIRDGQKIGSPVNNIQKLLAGLRDLI
jgi:hypothetical protein